MLISSGLTKNHWYMAARYATILADATKVSEFRSKSSKVSSVIVRSAVCTSEVGISNFGLSGMMSTHTLSLSKVVVYCVVPLCVEVAITCFSLPFMLSLPK
jgi:hypothetical protein